MLPLRLQAPSRQKRRPKVKSINNQGLCKELEDKQLLTISSTSRVRMKMMKLVKIKRKAKILHHLMTNPEEVVVEVLQNQQGKEVPEDPSAKYPVKRNKVMTRKMSKILKKDLQMRIANGKIDVIFAKELEVFFAATDARK